MSITASIHIHSPASDTEVRASRPALGDHCWLTVEEEGSYGSAEVTVFGTPEELHAFALRMVAAIEAEWPETAPARPLITIDAEGFRNVYDASSPIDDEERAAVDEATDAEIAEALAVGFDGDFWWGAFDAAYGDSLRALVAIRQAKS